MPRKSKSTNSSASATCAVIYVRVSSKEQEREGFSIDAQLRLLRSYAEQRGFNVLQEFTDVETAKRSGRTDFTKMLRFLTDNHGQCRTILVEKTDRLYRNFKDYSTLDDLDLEIHLVKEGQVLSRESKSQEKFVHGIKVLMAKNYIDNLSEETSKGMLEKAKQGIWPSNAPLGYRNVVGLDGKKFIQVDTNAAPVIRSLFERYSTGQYSLKQITAYAREQGFTFKKSGAPVNKSTVHTLLQNRIYTGDFDWDGQTYRGTHEPIVSVELWERVQAVLTGRYTKHHPIKHDFAFSGLITCGHCGCSLVGELKKGKYVYYHCTGYKGKCPEPYTRQEVLEQNFSNVLAKLRFDDEVLSWVRHALRESHADERTAHEEAISRLKADHERLQKRLDGMYVDKLDGRIDAAYFESKSREWRQEQDSLLRSIQQHQSANRSYIDQGVRIFELANRAHDLFQKQTAKEKRQLLNFVLSNCTWKDGELTATYRQPFDLLALASEQARKPAASVGVEMAQNKEWLLR